MRCILCDRCKKIVEDERKIKTVTYARPLNTGFNPVRGDDRSMNDHIWTKELCPACAEAFEEFMDLQLEVPDEAPSDRADPEDQPEDNG